MENKTKDINELVLRLAVSGMKPLLGNEIWQCYGFRKRPSHGAFLDRIFPKKFELENYIAKEILTLGLIDILNGIKKTTEDSKTKLLLSSGVIDHFLATTKHLFPSEVFMENLFTTYASILKTDKGRKHEPIILKARGTLNKKNFARFMVGTIQLLSFGAEDDYLLSTDNIKDIIEKSSKENQLEVTMYDMFKKYSPLILEKILKA